MYQSSLPAELSTTSRQEPLRGLLSALAPQEVSGGVIYLDGNVLVHEATACLSTYRFFSQSDGEQPVVVLREPHYLVRSDVVYVSAIDPDGVAICNFNRVTSTTDAPTIQGVSLFLKGSHSVAREPGRAIADERAPVDDNLARLEAARRSWKARFRSRVDAMEKLLANSADEDLPTPRADGDD